MIKNTKKWLLIGIFLTLFLIPYFMVNFDKSKALNTGVLQSQSFSKEDYTPILDEKSQGLGNITIIDAVFNEEGFFNNSQLHPNLDDDFSTGALDMIYNHTSYIETISVAQYDNLDDSILESKKIKILLNESLNIEYDYSVIGSEGYLIYGFCLTPVIIKEIYIHNQTQDPIIQLTENEYSIDSANFLNFDYFDYFQIDQNSFSIYILYEYELTIKNWILIQDSEEKILIDEEEQSISPKFTYNFTISGDQFNKTLDYSIPAYDLKMNIRLNLPDKEQLYDHSLWVNDFEVEDYLNEYKSINFSSYADYSEIMVDFNANFTIKFEDPIDYSWAIDRLVGFSDVRERIYFLNLVSGPDHIFLKDIYIFESTITIDQVLSNSSLFGRSVAYFDANVSIIQDELEKSLIFTKNSVKKKGLRIILPYIIKGEIIPFTFKYKASNDLKLIITDNIYMPLTGIKIQLLYYEKPYGTYISNELIQPMAPAYSDQNGEIILENVPNGVYTLRLYRNDQLLLETEVSSLEDINYIATDIIHFPIVVLVFTGIYSTILLIGLAFYLKKRRS